MSTFTGILSISVNGISSLNTSLLLMAGVAEPTEAMASATQFLTEGRNLHSGQMILVDGSAGVMGTVHIIRMTDAHAVEPEALTAIPLGMSASAKTIVAQRSKGSHSKSASAKRTSTKSTKAAKARSRR